MDRFWGSFSGGLSLSVLALLMLHFIIVKGKLIFILSNLNSPCFSVYRDPTVVLWFLNNNFASLRTKRIIYISCDILSLAKRSKSEIQYPIMFTFLFTSIFQLFFMINFYYKMIERTKNWSNSFNKYSIQQYI